MGKRKFRLSVHRKNEERNRRRQKKLQQKKQKTEGTTAESALDLVVSIPRHAVTVSAFKISVYRDGSVISVDQLCSQLNSIPIPYQLYETAHPL